MSSRHLLVIGLVFAIIFGSGLATYAVWSLLPWAGTLDRGVISLLTWVGVYYLGAVLFWRAVIRLSSGRTI